MAIKMDRYGVIMAGGGGTRFWPLSRKKMPKQFLNLTGKDTLVNETIDRIAGNMPVENIYIVTRFIVDVNHIVLSFHSFSWQSNDAFHPVFIAFFIMNDNNIKS